MAERYKVSFLSRKPPFPPRSQVNLSQEANTTLKHQAQVGRYSPKLRTADGVDTARSVQCFFFLSKRVFSEVKGANVGDRTRTPLAPRLCCRPPLPWKPKGRFAVCTRSGAHQQSPRSLPRPTAKK